MRSLFVLIILCLLPCGAFAAALDDADGVWRLDAAKTKSTPGGAGEVPISGMILNKEKQTLTLENNSQDKHAMPFTVSADTPDHADLKVEDGDTLRLEIKGDALSIGKLEGKKRVDVLYFTR